MRIADWIVNVVVLLSVGYLSFAMALAGWVAGLRRGEAVMLLPARGGRSNLALQLGLVIVALAACVALFRWLWIPLPVAVGESASRWLQGGGLVLFLAGAALTLWARSSLGRMWGISTSREVRLLPDHQLVEAGPFAFVRHPMYFGWWMAVLGILLIYRTWIVLLLLIMSLLVFYRRARLEERVLADRFGAQWQSYVARTHFLVPWLY